jgi:hypothetical protein
VVQTDLVTLVTTTDKNTTLRDGGDGAPGGDARRHRARDRAALGEARGF